MVNNPPAKARDAEDMGSDSGSGKFPGEGLGSPRQYSCLGNSMDRGGGGLQVTESQRVGQN